MSTMVTMDAAESLPGLLKLPLELRLQIYSYLLEPGQIMLTDIPCITDLETTKTQPDLARINRQLRDETLDIFYSSNIFVLKLFDMADVAAMTRYLDLVGDARLCKVRRLALCSWAKLGFGHMMFKWWWRVDIDLRTGTAVWDRAITWSEEINMMQSFKNSFETLFTAKRGESWSRKDLLELMEIFVLTCTTY